MLLVKQNIIEYNAINIITRYPDWDIATVYNFGDILFQGHYYYRSAIDNNLGIEPTDNDKEWMRWDISNRYAQIDLRARTFTTCDVDSKVGGLAPYDLISEFQNDRYDSISLNLSG